VGDSEAESQQTHWWHRAGFVTLLTAFIGVMVPLTAGVQAYVQKERELQLEREKYQQSIRLHYLDILVSSSLKDVEMFLTFISQTESSPELKQWAAVQLGSVRGRLAGLESDLAAAQKRADDAQKELEAAKRSTEEKVREAQAQATASKAQKEKAQDDARKAQTALADAQRKVEARHAEALDRKDALVRRRPMNTAVQQRANVENAAAAAE
jgi:hypothetical protein